MNPTIKKIVQYETEKYKKIIQSKEESLTAHIELLDKYRKQNRMLKRVIKGLQIKLAAYEES